MSAKSLDVFSLRDAVVGEYKKFATSFTTIHAEDIRQQVEAIYAEERYWPEPLIQINPSYKRATNVETLVGGWRARPGLRRDLPTGPDGNRSAAHSLQAPGAGDRPRVAGRELRRHDRHGLGQVALLLHPDRERRARPRRRANAPRGRARSSSTR